jgi:hypothetical protein
MHIMVNLWLRVGGYAHILKCFEDDGDLTDTCSIYVCGPEAIHKSMATSLDACSMDAFWPEAMPKSSGVLKMQVLSLNHDDDGCTTDACAPEAMPKSSCV